MVPHFKRLSDFILAKKWYMRALFMPGPERHDLDARMRRHGFYSLGDELRPDFSPFQIRYKDSHKLHMRHTFDVHQPR